MKDPEIAEQFAVRLKAERLRVGLSQEALAAKAGLDRSAVGQLECSETSPRLSTAMRLASALDVPLSQLTLPMRLQMAGGGEPVFEWVEE